MTFGKINRLILFGGSFLMAELVSHLKKKPYEVFVFSSRRQLNDPVRRDGTFLEDVLKEEHIRYFSTDDINNFPILKKYINEFTLGLGIGEPWGFSKELIEKFDGRLLDFMGIPLPRYRGGAHYSWQILARDKTGGCNLQIVNEDMLPAKFDSGAVIKSIEYTHPPSVRIPQDYFDSAVKIEITFLLEFLDEIEQGKDFKPSYLEESRSIFFPRLNTKRHSFIDWRWIAEDIEIFICAFDDPYPGASTFLDGKRVFIKKSFLENRDGIFHPFQSGLIYRIYNNCCYVACAGGTLIVHYIADEKGNSMIGKVKVGQRFYTPQKYLEEALFYTAEYDAVGLKELTRGDRRPL